MADSLVLCWQAIFIPFVGIVGNMYNRVWLIAIGTLIWGSMRWPLTHHVTCRSLFGNCCCRARQERLASVQHVHLCAKGTGWC